MNDPGDATLCVLFLSDSHLGLDLPARPRAERDRRGEELFESFERSLAPVLSGEATVLFHGGDLFYRSRIPAWLADRVYARLVALADGGADVLWVPGNHERSGVPRGLLLAHPRVHVFDRPRTVVVGHRGVSVAFSGLPFTATIRRDFPALLEATGWRGAGADARLLGLHQAVEGATVGPAGYVFRTGGDVLAGRDVPPGFAAVLSGHIHRAQVLRRDLGGRPLASPVLFAGSTDRISFAERFEPKGAFLLRVGAGQREGGHATWEFRENRVRPMTIVEVDPADPSLEGRLREVFGALDPRSLVRLRLSGPAPSPPPRCLSAAALRALAPATLSVTVAWRAARGDE